MHAACLLTGDILPAKCWSKAEKSSKLFIGFASQARHTIGTMALSNKRLKSSLVVAGIFALAVVFHLAPRSHDKQQVGVHRM